MHEQEDKEGRQPGASAEDASAGIPSQDETDLQSQLDAAQAEASEFKDKYLRAAAEMENIRRRNEREKQDLRQFALESLMQDVLPVLDSFEKAVPQDSSDDDAEVGGFALIKKQLSTVLSKHGLAAVAASGCDFDPNVHQAIQRVEDVDADKEVVQEEFQRGYTLNERLIRPAMVSVKVPGSAPTSETDEEST